MPIPTQVRVLFANCPKLDTLACAYLLLAQNEVQQEFEFSVQHYWVFAMEDAEIPWRLRLFSDWSDRRLPFRKWALGRVTAALDLKKAPLFRTQIDSSNLSAHTTQL